jgi:hypothetical protein
MIKRKFYLKDIESEGRKADQCFTDESYIEMRIPGFKEKIKIKEQMTEVAKDEMKIIELLESFVSKVHCISFDDPDSIIDSFDDLTSFVDAEIVIAWMAGILRDGFVPKKIMTV